jgi:hypothetical protein
MCIFLEGDDNGGLMRKLWKDYNLSIVLAVLFLASWAIQTWCGWVEYADEQQTHAEVATVLGNSGYIWHWGAATRENWQSEFLQLLTFVILTSFLIHRGSDESKDSDEEMMSLLKSVDRRLRQFETAGQGKLKKAS